MRRSVPLLLAVVALAVGCGESEKDKFIDDFRPLNDRLIAIGGDLGKVLDASEKDPDAVAERRLEKVARRLDEVRADIAALETPEDLSDESKALTIRLGAGVQSIRRISEAAGKGDEQGAAAATARLGAVSEEINAKQNALAKATGAAEGSR